MSSLLKNCIFLCTVLTVLFCQIDTSAARDFKDDGELQLDYFLKLVKEPVPVKLPVEGIENREDILFCTGNSLPAQSNNRAAERMLRGDYDKAKELLISDMPHSMLFLPYQYNIGLCYYHLNDRARSRLHLTKASQLVPEYFLTYIQLGNLDSFEGNDDAAIYNYRKALKLNPKHLNALVLVGDIYFKRSQIEAASKYYELVLTIDPLFPNALLGKGKVLFYKEQYYKAYQLLKMVSTKKEYDKSLHYYFGECAYKLQDYQAAYDHYTKLLEFKSDRFFITTSLKLIEHKQELAKRFVTQLEEE